MRCLIFLILQSTIAPEQAMNMPRFRGRQCDEGAGSVRDNQGLSSDSGTVFA
jgi:hypothetical protein